MPLHCGKNVVTSFFQGTTEDKDQLRALKKAMETITKEFPGEEDALTDVGLCPDRCIEKDPTADKLRGSWSAEKFQLRQLPSGKWRVDFKFRGTVTVHSRVPKKKP